ncbi:MAG: hypothetical protein Q9169_006582 [Polycauliona sp. 2 TL-2023]
MIFIVASSGTPNIGARLVFRFIAGFLGSAPLTCAGGSISDHSSPMKRVYAFPVIANAAFTGPIFGPVVGGSIGEGNLVSWRWTEWTTLMISGLVLASIVFLQPETYAPTLLKWKAAHLRSLTGDERYQAKTFHLDIPGPVIMLLGLYLTVIDTIFFTETYGFIDGITGPSFIGIGMGLCLASPLVRSIYRSAKRHLAKIKAEGGTRFPPEF